MFTFATALGTIGLTWTDDGVTRLIWPGELRGREAVPDADAPPWILDAATSVTALLDGERVDLSSIPVALGDDVSDLRRAVYEATRAIPAGETTTYGTIAKQIGQPTASREVGSALGANRIPIIIPCHRIIAADGALTGFSAPGGLRLKRQILEIERAPGFTQIALFPS
jgi:methylated-DNA-[protein]-cysteine S-methyltransferase